ncbi:SDR family NAD(P)-dependent oxidoreductase [Thalassotalea euphylliae]|uniref:SDR family NAD(P)-dependent oxidoreductase n=1 Tax=Thalassotalea euphylliae TaxID=1655234 RepID=A0A3E0TNM1_9GAMM|nr:SDR family oxidoreductase [Thalassotalea euphylliae]REL26201.1 SDR family NAD(P)-dependent oxidoreductase [Thalassotalea euphylliae]
MTTQQFGKYGWSPERIRSLAGKTYVITGANSGTGFEAARIFLSKGAKVVMMNRNPEKSAVAIGKLQQELGTSCPVSFIQMDLASLASVSEAAAQLLESVPQIDALICNAAIAQVAQQEITTDGFESQLGVNHFGHFLLCGLLFNRIEASSGRIVVVGSNAYKMGLKTIQFDDLNFDAKYTAWNAYAQSKLAQLMFAYELQYRLANHFASRLASPLTIGKDTKGSNVEVHVCHPGASRTNLLMDTASTFNKALWSVLSRVIAQPAEKGAWPQVMCATEQDLKPQRYYGPTKRAQTVGAVDECQLEALALEREVATKLWQVSEQKTGFTWPF